MYGRARLHRNHANIAKRSEPMPRGEPTAHDRPLPRDGIRSALQSSPVDISSFSPPSPTAHDCQPVESGRNADVCLPVIKAPRHWSVKTPSPSEWVRKTASRGYYRQAGSSGKAVGRNGRDAFSASDGNGNGEYARRRRTDGRTDTGGVGDGAAPALRFAK